MRCNLNVKKQLCKIRVERISGKMYISKDRGENKLDMFEGQKEASMAKIWESEGFWERVREMDRWPGHGDFINQDQKLGIYMKCYGKPLECGKQRGITI